MQKMSGISPPPSYSKVGVSYCPGRFDDLDGFLRVQGAFDGKPNYSKYEDVQFINPKRGAIIHIVDDETTPQTQHSPVHQRVMLVVRHEDPMPRTTGAMTCIPLCHYDGELTEAKDRCWSVQQDHGLTSNFDYHDHARNSSTATPVSQKSLSVILKRNTHLEQGIQANLGELWRVGYGEILVDKIGQASNESLAPALSRIGELLAPDVRRYEIEEVTSPDVPKYKTVERRPPKSNRKKGIYVVGDSRKGHWVKIK